MALIHLVEDDLNLRDLYETALSGRGHEITTSRNLEGGLGALAVSEPDLVMTDLSLPDGSGFTMVRAAARRSIPVLIASGNSTERDFLTGNSSGARDFLVKPFPITLLLSKVERLLNSRGSAAEALLPGGRANAFGRYQILETIGRGGSGVVYRALDTHEQEEVALKVQCVREDCEEGAERLRRRFQREAYSLCAVDHPNLIGIRGHGNGRGFDYIAMELVSGMTLADRIRERGPLDEASLRLLIGRLASGLASIHSRGLVHRDLKPENIMLRGGAIDAPVIIDFGLTKLPFDRSLTLESERHGTPAFMAPEQIKTGETTSQSDLFSLGLVACFAATARRAFPGLELSALLEALATRPVRVPELSPRLRGILQGLTKVSPALRTKSAEEVVGALELAVDSAQ